MSHRNKKSLFGIIFGLMIGVAGTTAFIVACDNGPNNAKAQSEESSNCTCTFADQTLSLEEPITVNGTVAVQEPVTVDGTVSLGQQPIEVRISSPKFLGITDVERAGDEGFGTLNNDCNDAYPGSRMCTDIQLINSFPAPQPSNGAYVLMTVAALSVYTINDTPISLTVGTYGHISTNGMNCIANDGLFATTSGTALVLRPSGNMGRTGCGTSNRTACCGY